MNISIFQFVALMWLISTLYILTHLDSLRREAILNDIHEELVLQRTSSETENKITSNKFNSDYEN